MGAKKLFTIGYEGAELAEFLATLIAHGVEQVVDVRDVPSSRKSGFSKRALADALAASGIAYVHLKQLGDPKPGRDAARRGQFNAFRTIYRLHLTGPEAQTALKMAAAMASKMTSCLLCFERVHEHCHRAIVAEALSDRADFAIEHLRVRRAIQPPGKRDYGYASDRTSALR